MKASFLLVTSSNFERDLMEAAAGRQPREFTTHGLLEAARAHFDKVDWIGTDSKSLRYKLLKPIVGIHRAKGLPQMYDAWRLKSQYDVVLGMKHIGVEVYRTRRDE